MADGEEAAARHNVSHALMQTYNFYGKISDKIFCNNDSKMHNLTYTCITCTDTHTLKITVFFQLLIPFFHTFKHILKCFVGTSYIFKGKWDEDKYTHAGRRSMVYYVFWW